MSNPFSSKNRPLSRLYVAIFSALLFIGLFAFISVSAPHAHALTPGALTITSAIPYAPRDAQACNKPAEGPQGMHLQVDVTNNTAGTLRNLSANFDGFSTPGFALSAGETPARRIGDLAPGQKASLFWHIVYPCAGGVTGSFRVTVGDGAGDASSAALAITTRSEVSARAGGGAVVMVVGPGNTAGATIAVTTTYGFGNADAQATALVEPAVNAGFPAGCFQLIGSKVVSSNFTAGLPAGATNQLYFGGVATPKGGGSASVAYYFKALCNQGLSNLHPFADITSGSQQKYTTFR